MDYKFSSFLFRGFWIVNNLLLSCLVYGQVCVGDVFLASQADVDAFACTQIIGHLTISGNDITHIDSLHRLQWISQNLYILNNDSLSSLKGLSKLDSVGGWITILANQQLETLEGLDNIQYVEKSIFIEQNKRLISLEGFPSINSIPLFLTISSNDSLTSLLGLEQLQFVGGLNITSNKLLENLDGLANLKTIVTNMYITENPSLESIDGLGTLESIGSFCKIVDNQSLVEMDGLDSLLYIGKVLEINGNDSLRTIGGFSGLKSIQIDLRIIDNPSLQLISGFRELDTVKRDILFRNNSRLKSVSGLNSIKVVESIIVSQTDSLVRLDAFSLVQSLEGKLFVGSNQSLLDLGYFESLVSVDKLTISENPRLKSLNSLASLEEVRGDMGIIYNDRLIQIDSLSNLLKVGGNLSVMNNGLLTRGKCCGLYPLLKDGEVGGNINIAYNGMSDPTDISCSVQDILSCISSPIFTAIDPSFQTDLELMDAYPNPCFDRVTIPFRIDKGSSIQIRLLDKIGREMILHRQFFERGDQFILFHVSNLAGGLYFYQLVSDQIILTKPLTIR